MTHLVAVGPEETPADAKNHPATSNRSTIFNGLARAEAWVH